MAPQHSECPLCHDTGFVVPDVPVGDPRFGTALPCRCTVEKRRARLAQRLKGMDAMTDEEAGKRFEDLINIYEGNDVIGTVRRWTAGGSGLLTLVGPYGTGKTTLLCCAVNYVNNQGGTAVYTTAKRLLDYLRSTYGDEAEMSFDRAWDTLTTVPMLAIDELDKVATRSSDWAREQLDTLVDTRWRHQHEWLTLTAMNETVEALPGAMASRLADGRGKVIQVRARDMRPWMGGE